MTFPRTPNPDPYSFPLLPNPRFFSEVLLVSYH